MRLIDFLAPEKVLLNYETKSKKSLFCTIAELCHKASPDINSRSVFSALIKREKLGSTDINNGMALPHAQIDGLPYPLLFIIKLRAPIDYDAYDKQPIWLAIALLTPRSDDEKEQHSTILARLIKMLGDSDVREKIKAVANYNQLWEIIKSLG